MRLFITNPRPPSRLRNISDEKETNDRNPIRQSRLVDCSYLLLHK